MKRRGWARERILRVLLNNPTGDLSKYVMAKLAGVTYSWAHNFLNGMEEKGLIRGTRVVKYEEIAYLWRDMLVVPRKRRYIIGKPMEFVRSTGLRYALTTFAAEALWQYYLFPSRVEFYVYPEDESKWHDALSNEGRVGGGNTVMFIGDPHVFYKSAQRGGFHTVSLPQLIADLRWTGGVCGEAADMLIEKEMRLIVSTKRN